jgi:glucans biosynthesis protein
MKRIKLAPSYQLGRALGMLAPLLAACAQHTRVAERPDAPRAETPAQRAPSGAERAAACPPGSFEATASLRDDPRPEAPPRFFEQVKAEAKALAEKPAPPQREIALPPELRNLSYDAYRAIRFRPEHSLWRGESEPFEIQFFHPGRGYIRPLTISVIENDTEHVVPFNTDWFSYEGLPHPPPAAGLTFAGLRVQAPLNQPNYRDEVVVFQGASYFRPLGKGSVYGISARGLAVDLGEPRPEEFPVFTHFYLVHPAAKADALWILALLESPRVTGAYAFQVRPGSTTLIDVTAALFVREPIAALGLAPLTSMFVFGEDEPNRFGDFRPEVHDSDGLSIWSSTGEWLFRPLRNPRKTVASTFQVDSPRGFGLLQRDRTFDHYQDLEARYQDRPSLWVEPLSGFERGSLRLLEIADKSETTDNIATAWMPAGGAAKGQSFALSYRLRVGNHVAPGPEGRARATRIGQSDHGARFLVDFAGSKLDDDATVEAVISSTGGRVLEQHLEKNTYAQGLRASFEVAADAGAKDIELRAFLRAKSGNHDVLTETWSYLWQPK